MLVPSVAIPIALAVASVAQPRAHEWAWGHWVIAASIAADREDVASTIAQVAELVEKCGYVTFHDLSAKFALFVPGSTVVVVGPFELESAAELARERIQPCVPEVYVKFGGYLGRGP
jgi:hypothetical protein